MGNEMTADEVRKHYEDLRQILRHEGLSFHRSEKPGMVEVRFDATKLAASEASRP